jgi:hypothetical protein
MVMLAQAERVDKLISEASEQDIDCFLIGEVSGGTGAPAVEYL